MHVVSKSETLNCSPVFVAKQDGLCRTWSETPDIFFLSKGQG